jgi:two-component system, chemotaxis family, protein-glutamate methylesterase/glutaminase
MPETRYKAVAIGASAGGLRALSTLLSSLPSGFRLPAFVVQHIDPSSETLLVSLLNSKCAIPIKEAEDKEEIVGGTVYIAPPNYHLLVERDHRLELSVDEKENYSRPSIDVLFESASETYREGLIGVILTGSSEDGAKGLAVIKLNGGCGVVQEPTTAEYRIMPESAIQKTKVDHVLDLEEIADFLIRCSSAEAGRDHG